MAAAAAWLAASACRRPARASDVAVEWSLSPSPPSVGRGVLRLDVFDADRQPVRGASLRVEGHMSHPGMAPVLATAIERDPGRYEVELEFTMRGDWILLVSGSLANGERLTHRIDLPDVRPPG